ncbi:hypothetical protein SAMN05661093_01060 [Kibdelosporangium aridum]|uniref:Aspartate carbamoyltransferase n=2 Tax=Kibdelosporangium aridum TaxID=2030 RepID=A0A1W2ART1_KIBAR|nr:hypothetical protein SAMN05661093_01060 [Kibdelosporangium aridum]
MIAGKPVAALLCLAVLGTACSAPTSDPGTDRQAQVAEKGQSVMPFDLDKTTHRFTPREDGLLQEVFADTPDDTNQINLIREHIATEADRFRRGDFSDPATIHGTAMPGLAELSSSATKITIAKADLPNGASLTFRTTDPALVKALHVWSEAQVADHGKHAEHGTT